MSPYENPAHLALAELLRRVEPGSELLSVVPLGTEGGAVGSTEKSAGYGIPLKLAIRRQDGSAADLVFRTATANVFGHEWRADRAAEMLLAFDTFAAIPDHIKAVDVGAVAERGDGFVSLTGAGEFYLLTNYAPGTIYAGDLRGIAQRGELTDRDRRRSTALAEWLAGLHAPTPAPASAYARSVRDVVGGGEGIFGIVDGYPPNVPAASPARLNTIEQRCVEWRWRLRDREERLCRIHGDFHPFNIVFENDTFTVLDASRGCLGDPANDVASMAVNYVFFSIDDDEVWRGAFRELWYGFWSRYRSVRRDDEMYEVIAPYLAWRILVLCNPVWYPALAAEARDRLLSFGERVLRSPRFDPEDAEMVFRGRTPGA